MVSLRPLLFAGLALLGTVPAWCASHAARSGPARAANLAVETNGMLSVNFFSMADTPQIVGAQGVGTVNLGKVSYAAGSDMPGVTVQRVQRGFYVQTAVGMRIGNVTSLNGQTVSMKAWLQSPANPYQIYLDGVELTTQPVMVDTRMFTGVVTRHELKIHVPSNTSEKESSLQSEISVQVVRN
jgi:hypothetical protein